MRVCVCERAKDPEERKYQPLWQWWFHSSIVRTKAKLNVEKTFDMPRSRRVQMHIHTIKEMIMENQEESRKEKKKREKDI